jgi:hypothetical protein
MAIVAWRAERRSWLTIARLLLLSGIRLADGREWSIGRCRRMHAALTSGKIAAADRLVTIGLAATREEAKRRALARKERQGINDLVAVCRLVIRAARMG